MESALVDHDCCCVGLGASPSPSPSPAVGGAYQRLYHGPFPGSVILRFQHAEETRQQGKKESGGNFEGREVR